MNGSSAQQVMPRGQCVRRPLEQHLKDCDNRCSSADHYSDFQLPSSPEGMGLQTFIVSSWTNVEYAIQIFSGVQH